MKDRNLTPSRRAFLRNVGLLASGAAVAGLPAVRAAAQQYPDPNENCAPPGTQSTPTPFTPNTSLPMRTRKSVFALTAFEQSRLNSAYTALRALPASDPRTWLSQAHVHCFYCSGSQNVPSNVEIHGAWTFMPWHRCYLYFHERILASLVGDNTFALPYWDWDNTPDQAFPPLYANSGSALFDQLRLATVGSTPTVGQMFNANGVDIPQIMQEPDYELFMGTANSAGGVEAGPHGDVHLWTADPELNFTVQDPDMGILQTAGRDPVFFAHHGEIDRFWWSWIRAGNQNPPDVGWLSTRWTFYDENQNWISIAVADVISAETSLFYNYDSAISPQTATAKKSKVFLSAQQGPPVKQGPEPTTQKITVPSEVLPQMTATATTPRKYILHIDGIDVPPDRAAMVRVFVNMPKANAKTSAKSPNFVSTFTIVPSVASGSTAHQHKKLNVAFNVSRQMAGVLKGKSTIEVTLVPVSRLNQLHENIQLTYDRVYITEK